MFLEMYRRAGFTHPSIHPRQCLPELALMAGALTRSGAASVLLSSASRALCPSSFTRSFPLPIVSLPIDAIKKKRLFLGSFCTSSSQVPTATETIRSIASTDADADAAPSPSSAPDPIKESADALDIRVGRIVRAWRHPEADSLYVEEVDLGEPEPRTICSGLVNYIPLEDLHVRTPLPPYLSLFFFSNPLKEYVIVLVSARNPSFGWLCCGNVNLPSELEVGLPCPLYKQSYKFTLSYESR